MVLQFSLRARGLAPEHFPNPRAQIFNVLFFVCNRGVQGVVTARFKRPYAPSGTCGPKVTEAAAQPRAPGLPNIRTGNPPSSTGFIRGSDGPTDNTNTGDWPTVVHGLGESCSQIPGNRPKLRGGADADSPDVIITA
eukprot:gene9781-biopygen11046